jgi:hypothetical protein
MPALDVMPEKTHLPAMSPAHHDHCWDASGAPTPVLAMHKRYNICLSSLSSLGAGFAVADQFLKQFFLNFKILKNLNFTKKSKLFFPHSSCNITVICKV